MTLLTASLYLLCLAFLLGSAVFVCARDPRSRLNGCYALLALALLGWVGTLFVFGSLPEGRTLLLIGRLNFAAAAVAVTASFLFAAELAGRRPRLLSVLWLETALLTALSLGTPLIDRAETVVGGLHSTIYGPLFALYIVHIVGYLAGAVIVAFRAPVRAGRETRTQLRLVGSGTLATALAGVTANLILPYGFGDFRFIHVGTLSTILLLAAVAYAVFAYHLFSVRVIVRAAFVTAGLVALALELYSLALSSLSRLLPLGNAEQRHFAATALVLVVNAFTQQPVRRWLEQIVERLIDRLSGRHHSDGYGGRPARGSRDEI